MSRPPGFRRIASSPKWPVFRPQGAPRSAGAEIVLGLDELEALRLADREGLHHEKAARLMRISRPTFSRLVGRARKKVAEALVEGRPLKLVGSGARAPRRARIYCPGCRFAWRPSPPLGKALSCPRCVERRGRRSARA